MNPSIMKKIILAIVILVVIALGGIVFWTHHHARHPSHQVSINTQNQPTLGNQNAKVHIVAFEDLKCANCMRFSTQLFPKLKKQFIDTGIAQYTMINLAFIPGSMPAANAAHCLYVQNPKLFFAFVDYVYHHQPPETDNWATIPTLMEMASHIEGINTDKLETCLVQADYNDVIHNNLKEAIKVMGATVATPSVYVNGYAVSPLTWKQLERAIKQAQQGN